MEKGRRATSSRYLAPVLPSKATLTAAKRAEKKAYLKNEAQRYFRGESDGPSPWNGEYQGKM